MSPDERGMRVEKRQDVLELVAKTKAAARLVEGGSAAKARCHRLVEKPSVAQPVERWVGRAHSHTAEQPLPECLARSKGFVDGAGGSELANELERALSVFGLTEEEADFDLLTWAYVEVHLEGSARVAPGVLSPGQSPTSKCCGVREVAVPTEHLHPIAGPAVKWSIAGEKCEPAREIR
jgi:hypothetical protein